MSQLESAVARDVRLALQKLGVTLFRNTVGRFQVIDVRGETRFIQAGLCVGSSDFIGFTEYTIRPQDVGRTVAVFTAVETKRAKGGVQSEDQQNFINRVSKAGGIAGFAKSVETAIQLVRAATK